MSGGKHSGIGGALPETFAYGLPTRVIYGAGVVDRLGDELPPLGAKRALLVTDSVLVGLGLAGRLERGLAGAGIELVATFDQVPQDSEVEAVESCAALGREAGAELVVALGGGSVLDTAKAANLLLVEGGRLEDHQGARRLDHRLLPAIFVPTTAGTGAEVTDVAVIADHQKGVKLPFVESPFLPDVAVLDPSLTTSLPPRLTASTAMDALTHAVEAYVDREHNPFSDALALHAVRLLRGSLLRAVQAPDDLQARGALLLAANLAGIAFSHSMVGVVHAIAHALGGVYGVPHGTANALLLPHGMAYNLDAEPGRFAELGLALGASPLLPAPLRARAAVRLVEDLLHELARLGALPRDLRGAGVEDGLARMEQVVERALEDGSVLYNPRPVRAEDVRDILRRALDGRPARLPLLPRRRAATGRKGGAVPTGAFRSTDELYDLLGGFFLELKERPELRSALLRSGIRVRFRYHEPEAVITVDASGDELRVDFGESTIEPEVEMEMDADFAHAFWLGRANLVSALARRRVKARGNVPRTVKLLPVLEPAYQLYPRYLASKGREDLLPRS